MREKKHTHCICCRRIRLKQDIAHGICTSCKKYRDPDYFLKNDALPVWYENGDTNNKPNFHLPSELKNLTLSEKMLIQRVSPFLALQHIKNVVMGLKGLFVLLRRTSVDLHLPYHVLAMLMYVDPKVFFTVMTLPYFKLLKVVC